MYTVKTLAKPSKIDGKGVFADEIIIKGTIVWKYDPARDVTLTPDEFNKQSESEKEHFYHSAYLSPWTGLWICPPEDEAANYTNHSADNNTSVVYDAGVSSKPYFIANQDIARGEEITNNYHEFDEITRKQQPEWANQVSNDQTERN